MTTSQLKSTTKVTKLPSEATKELAYELPDDEAFVKAVKASKKFKESKEK